MKKLIALILFFSSSVLIAVAQIVITPNISCENVANAVGQSGTLCAQVKGVVVDSYGNVQLYLCAPFPGQSVTVTIAKTAVSKFKISPTLWGGKNICVTGVIATEKGKPVIKVNSKNQVTGRTGY